MKMIKSIIMIFLVVGISGQLFAQDKLPNVTVSKLNGQSVEITEMVKDNQLVVITFWATWCIPCRKELENIQELYPEWQENYDVLLIAVSIDDARGIPKIKPYVDGQGFEYLVLVDENKDLFRAVNGTNPPLTLIVNSKGEILDIKNKYVEGDEYILEDKLAELSSKH